MKRDYRDKLEYKGTDNYGNSKTIYLDKIAAMSDEDLKNETYSMIYQSARCSNNHRADWHWKCDVCYDESLLRDGDIYQAAYDKCYKDHIG